MKLRFERTHSILYVVILIVISNSSAVGSFIHFFYFSGLAGKSDQLRNQVPAKFKNKMWELFNSPYRFFFYTYS
ncbi:MAG: hypothetical protein K8R17_06020, partial [Methanosarcinales archaeon]|nr:hypothetical protein [Methanosarcinales archaeon]